MSAAVAVAVARREDDPARRHPVVAEPAIEDQLVGRGGDRGRGRGDLVQEQDAALAVARGVRQQRRDRPLDEVAFAKRHAAQIRRLHLREPDIDERHAVRARDAGYDLRLADARRPPQHHRRMGERGGSSEFAVEYPE